MKEETFTKQRFVEEVEALRQKKGRSFIEALYTVMDSWLTEWLKFNRIKLACRAGCGYCCYQLVVCTDIEWGAIRGYLASKLPKNRTLRERLKDSAREWKAYEEKQAFRPRTSERVWSDTLRTYDDFWGKPCSCLDPETNKCTIYPVRPIDCRTLTSLVSCGPEIISEQEALLRTAEGPKRMRFSWELWANNLVMEEEAHSKGVEVTKLGVIPLIGRVLHDEMIKI